MDFQSLPRKKLQALCKNNKIPANMTNVAMADALQSLATVEGLDQVTMVMSPQKTETTMMTPKPPRSAASVRNYTSRSTRAGAKEGDGECRKEVGGIPVIEITDTPVAVTGRKVPRGRQAAKKMTEGENEADCEGNKESDCGPVEVPPVTPATVVSTRRSSLRLRERAATPMVEEKGDVPPVSPVPLASYRRSRTRNVTPKTVESEGYSKRRVAVAQEAPAREVVKMVDLPTNEEEGGGGPVDVPPVTPATAVSTRRSSLRLREKAGTPVVKENGDCPPAAPVSLASDRRSRTSNVTPKIVESEGLKYSRRRAAVAPVVPAREVDEQVVDAGIGQSNAVGDSVPEEDDHHQEEKTQVSIGEVSAEMNTIAGDVAIGDDVVVKELDEDATGTDLTLEENNNASKSEEEKLEEQQQQQQNGLIVLPPEMEESAEYTGKMESKNAVSVSFAEEEEVSREMGVVEIPSAAREEAPVAVEEEESVQEKITEEVELQNPTPMVHEEESSEEFMEEQKSEISAPVEEEGEMQLENPTPVVEEEECEVQLENPTPVAEEEEGEVQLENPTLVEEEEEEEESTDKIMEEVKSENSAPVEEECEVQPENPALAVEETEESHEEFMEELRSEKCSAVEEECKVQLQNPTPVGKEEESPEKFTEELKSEIPVPAEENTSENSALEKEESSVFVLEEHSEKSAPVVEEDDESSAIDGEKRSEKSAPEEEELPADNRDSAASIENSAPVEEVAEIRMEAVAAAPEKMQKVVTALVEETTTVPVRTPARTIPTRDLLVLQDQQLSPRNANREVAVDDDKENSVVFDTNKGGKEKSGKKTSKKKQKQAFEEMSLRKLKSAYRITLTEKNTTNASATAPAKAEKRPALAALSECCLNSPLKQNRNL